MTVKHIKIKVNHEQSFCEIPLAGTNLRSLISLAQAGYMGDKRPEGFHNYLALVKELGLEQRTILRLKQVHSQGIVLIKKREDSLLNYLEGDGFISCLKEPILAITVADCLPILLYDEGDNVFGLLHSGWRGTGILMQAFKFVKEAFQIEARQLRLCFGPAIGSCCYRVPEERYQYFLNNFGKKAVRFDGKDFFLDLREANLWFATDANVKEVTVIDNCTCCEEYFGSYRRQGKEVFCNMLVMLGYF